MAMSVSIMMTTNGSLFGCYDARGVFPGVRLVGDIILYFVGLPGVGASTCNIMRFIFSVGSY